MEFPEHDAEYLVVHHPKYGGEQLILDHIATSYLSLARTADRSDGRDKIFIAEEDFWGSARRDELRGSNRITLRRFCVTEWIPTSPGEFHSHAGAISRQSAEDQLLELDVADQRFLQDTASPDVAVYTPTGKYSMLDGGLGCVRLQDKLTEYGRLWFMSASSSAMAYAGIPVALHESIYEKVIDHIATEGGMWCDLTGRLAFLPELQMLYRTNTLGPKFVLVVDGLSTSTSGELSGLMPPLASGAVTFRGGHTPKAREWEIGFREDAPNYAYIRFRPGLRGTLEKRLPWLEWYVEKVGATSILTDFDEQMTRFRDAKFSLSRISSGDVAEDDLEEFFSGAGRRLYIRQAQIRMYLADLRGSTVGDIFSNIGAGANIVNRSQLQNSLNTISGRDAGLAEALKVVAEHVESAGDADAAEIFDGLSEEIGRSEPRKARLRTFWNGLVQVLPAVCQLGEASAKMIEAISQ